MGERLSYELSENVSFTGHSLGGSLAALQTLVSGRDSITFNAKGINTSTALALKADFNFQNRISAFEIEGQLLSGIQDNKVAKIALLGVQFHTGLDSELGSALGVRSQLSAYDLQGRTLEDIDTHNASRAYQTSRGIRYDSSVPAISVPSALDLHGMDYVIQSARHNLLNGQLTPDLLKNIRTY